MQRSTALPADKMGVALLLGRQSLEVLPDLKPNNGWRGIGIVLGKLLGVHGA